MRIDISSEQVKAYINDLMYFVSMYAFIVKNELAAFDPGLLPKSKAHTIGNALRAVSGSSQRRELPVHRAMFITMLRPVVTFWLVMDTDADNIIDRFDNFDNYLLKEESYQNWQSDMRSYLENTFASYLQ